MRKLALSILVVLVAAVPGWALTSISAYKTFTREVLTSDDLNQSFTTMITPINNLIALHPGDSTKTTYGVFDTLVSKPDVNLDITSGLVFRDNDDSLVVPGRASIDTVKVDDQLWVGMSAPVVGFSGVATAGTRLRIPYLSADTLNVDSLTVIAGGVISQSRIDADSIYVGGTAVVGFSVAQTSGTKAYRAYASIDSLTTDSLTAIGPTSLIGAVGVTGTTTLTGLLTQPAGNRTDLEYASIDSLNTDSLTVIGPMTITGDITVGTGETIGGDDTDITVTSGGAIDLTATTDVVVPANVGVTFGTGEKIEGDDTDLTVTSGGAIDLTATTDVVLPANVGATFGTGEKIEGDNTDLTVTSGAAINLTATTDVVVPTSVGVTFGSGEKIEGDDTDLTITSGADVMIAATGVGLGSTINPDGTAHVHTATAGSATSGANADDLTIENSTHGGATILTPDDSFGAYKIGSPTDDDGLHINWSYDAHLASIGTDDATGQMRLQTAGSVEAVRIDASQNIIAGHTAARAASGFAQKVTIEGIDGAFDGGLSIANNATADAEGAALALVRSGGTTAGSATIVTDDDVIGRIDFNPADGVDARVIGGQIKVIVDDASPAANAIAAEMIISTNSSASVDPVEALHITSDQRVQSRKFYHEMIDTTIAAMSAKKLRFVNLHSPVDVWFPDATDSYARYRQIEQGTSLWRTDAIRHPAFAVARMATAGDSLSIYDMTAWSEDIVFEAASGDMFSNNVVANDFTYQDGLYLAGSNSGNRTSFMDLLEDRGYRIDTSNLGHFKGRISDRNAGSGFTAMNSLAIINGTVNAVAVTRSPWPFHLDVLGRRLPYWVVGTSGGQSAASYDANGTLSIYDGNAVAVTALQDISPQGIWGWTQTTGGDQMPTSPPIWSITGDGFLGIHSYQSTVGGGSPILLSNSANFFPSLISVRLPRRLPQHAMSDKIVLGGPAEGLGLQIVDEWVDAKTDGCVRYINESYVTPSMCGNISLAFSGASTADVSQTATAGRELINNNTVTFVANTDGPGGHYGNFVAASSQVLAAPDHTDFDGLTALSIGSWIYRDLDSGAKEMFLAKSQAGVNTSYTLSVDASDLIELQVRCDVTTVTSAGPAIALATWYYAVGTWDGTTQKLYLNGVLVDSDAQSGSLVDGAYPFHIGGQTSGGGFANEWDGRIWGAFLTAEVLTPAQIAAQYAEGLEYINSPSNDLLTTGGDVDWLSADRYSGSAFLLGDEAGAEIRLPSGALVDTFQCTGCGTIAAGDIASWAGQDSMSVIFGGSTGSRYIGPDPTVIGGMNHNLTWEDVTFGSPVVVDSAGHGDFWVPNDAIAAAGVQGEGHIYVRKGTYPTTTMDVAGMLLTGASKDQTIFDGGITNHGVIMTGARTTAENIGVTTTAGGGQDYDGISMQGTSNTFRNGRGFGGDRSNVYVTNTAAKALISNIESGGADGACFTIDGPRTRVIGVYAEGCGLQSLEVANEGDNFMISGLMSNDGSGQVIHADAENGHMSGGTVTAATTDNSGTSTVTEEVY